MNKKKVIILIVIFLLCFIAVKYMFSSVNENTSSKDETQTKTETIKPNKNDQKTGIDSTTEKEPSKYNKSTNSDDSGLDESIEGTITNVTDQ